MRNTQNMIDTAERVIKAAHSKRNKFYKDCGINYQRVDTYLDKGIGKFSDEELKAIEDKIADIFDSYLP
jgi:tRNA(His) 5'-end guanylyltransferase